MPSIDRFMVAPPQQTEPPVSSPAPTPNGHTSARTLGVIAVPAQSPATATPANLSAAHSTANRTPAWLLLALLVLAGTGWLLWRRSHRLARETDRLARQHRALQSIHKRLRNESEQLRQQATNDPLTGVLNRQAFASGLREMLEHLSHYDQSVHLIVLDLDHFKAINDRMGHLVGDQALTLVTGVAHEHLDSADLLGRFGGDEFLIACTDHDPASAAALAEAIRGAVETEAARHEPPLPELTLSMGLAHAGPDTGYSADALFARADAALYEAKRQGRNRVVTASDDPPATTSRGIERHL
ncbi:MULTISPECIES: GGDEF domain-containing protein [Oleiagrimonas]|uniref:diguanylate cyclase n=1 Tax=Oleiagrimonas citrea TaxID=1665687 RepID=A0A846ZJ24_9GAMM|nr:MULTISPECIES: GGDEF domain-containing protein [Oleiagrimonas]NKZ37568.1 GGDEF domain-containing protein [Oleiagrimonas citrea]